MGKSNRIRNNRAHATLTGVKPKNKKQGMPSWAMNLITIAVAAVILFSVAFSLMSSNGVFTRMQTAMKSDNFRVDANMMKYFFKTQYSNFISQNSSYLSSYGLDTSVSLKDQYVDASDESQGTWFDYMMEQTRAQVEEMLIYCEEAEARDIELDDEDIEAIDAELENYETYAATYGYTTNAYVANVFGKGMKIKDIRNALELSALASKCSAEIGAELGDGISMDDIATEYGENADDYNVIDILTYTFDVTYADAKAECADDATEETIVAKYKEMIGEAREKAAELAGISDKTEFENKITELVVNSMWDKIYESDIEVSEVINENLPNETDTAAIREDLVAYIIDLIKNDKDLDADAVVTDNKVLGEIPVDETYADAIKIVVDDVYDNAKTEIEACLTENVKYTDTDDAIEWAFEDGRKAGDRKTIETGDGADGAEISNEADELKSFSADVNYLVKAPYKNESLTKNVAMMVFNSTANATAAIEKLSEGITVEEFEDICNELEGQFVDYENYTKGSLGTAVFDTWLYGEDVAIGSYTTSYITVEETSFVVAMYYEDGDEHWAVDVKNSIYGERYEEFVAELTDKYTVTTKDKVLAKIEG